MKGVVIFVSVLHQTLLQGLARTTSPVAKVQELLTEMQAKITAEGNEAKKIYEEYKEWCEDEARKLGFAIRAEKQEMTEQSATIEEATATQTTFNSKVEQFAGIIASVEKELEEATNVRKKEASDFKAETKELSEVIALVDKAIMVLNSESPNVSFAQMKGANNLMQAFSAMVQASMFSSADAARVASLAAISDEETFGEPAAAAYKEHDSGIIDTLKGMGEKARKQLKKVQDEENTALHNFQMLKQSLEDDLKHGKADMANAKRTIAASSEKKATSEGELEETTKELAADKQSREDLQAECMEKSRDYEATAKSRGEELEALSAAKKAIADSTGGAEKLTYGFSQASLLQLQQRSKSPESIRVPLAVVRRFRTLAQQGGSTALAQLASRMATAVSLSTMQGVDPFKKVRDMIASMLKKLEADAASEATNKEFCDKELAESSTKKNEKEGEIEKLSTKIEQMSSRSQKLKQQVSTLQQELADIAKSQSEMEALRKEESSSYMSNKKQLEEGLQGVKIALKVLREYYDTSSKDHDASGSASSLIAMVEVCESDFSKGLSEAATVEEASQAAFEEQSKDNKVDTAAKQEAVKSKTKEAAELDKAVTEHTSDRSSVQEELDAVYQYFDKIKDQCVAKPVPYEERKKERENTIASLKEGLEILEGEEALVQKSSRRTLRVVKHSSLTS